MLQDYLSPQNEFCVPQFFYLTKTNDLIELEKLLKSNQSIQVVDEFKSQVFELIKLRNPKRKLTKNEYNELYQEYLNGKTEENCGVWIYYSWLNKVVHLLNESEFIEVRTNRNHYKITPAEEKLLFQKKIGIIGLSVGKSIALTIALERICGEIVLADFDEIELSNLNRIQTSVLNFGVKKTVVVAREIAEIDPYLKVTCIHEGLTEENADDFFLKDRKLDVCIEVCDGLYEKILARRKAKQYGVPVVMNSSDRGTTDIERFDLDPSLPILHGLIDHLDLDKLKLAKTNEEKVPYLLPMLGLDTSSNRLKASMLEIEETITTWPQLASGVVFGGGICTDVCRRLLLGEIKNSGRYFVDIQDLINDTVDTKAINKKQSSSFKPIDNSKLLDYEDLISKFELKFSKYASLTILSETEIKQLVEAAVLAPSGGNTQPWKWIYKNGLLFLFNDINRRKSILNYKNNANHLTFGAATENLIIKAKAHKIEVNFELFPLDKESNLIAVFSFEKDETIVVDDLYSQINKRATNRDLFKSKPISDASIIQLQNVIKNIEGVSLKEFRSLEQINEIKAIICELDRLFYTSKAGHHHFMHELRWDEEENLASLDGLDIDTINLTPTEKVGLVVAKNWDVVKYNNEWKLGSSFKKSMNKAITNAGALAMLIMPKENDNKFFQGGRALERLWLKATQLNIGLQPVSINAFIFPRVKDDCFEELSPISNELQILSEHFFKVCGINKDEQNVFFFRLVSESEPSKRALRRSIEDVLIYA